MNDCREDAALMAKEEELLKLIELLRDPDPAVVWSAIDTMNRKWWMNDGSLRNADLSHANFRAAYLVGANLAETDLSHADMSEALMSDARLQSATLLGTDLSGAHTPFVSFLGATHLTITQLRSTTTLEGCTLPDGVRLPASIEMGDDEPDWQTPFEAWCRSVATDEDGYITPADVPRPLK